MSSLEEVKGVLQKHDRELYWTGLSLHLIYGFNWYQNTSLKASISEDVTPPSLKRWHCFLASKATERMERRRCNESHFYICEKNTSESKLFSTQSETATTRLLASSPETMANTAILGTTTIADVESTNENKQTSETVPQSGIKAQLTTTSELTNSDTTFASTETDNGESPITGVETSPANVTAAKTHNPEVIAPSLTKRLTSPNTVLPTARVQPSITDNITIYDSKKKKQIARKKLQDSTSKRIKSLNATNRDSLELQDTISKIKALNATNRDSLKNATNTVSNLFKKLKQLKTDKKSSANVLLATQELESFAIKYGRFHYKENESNVISEEHYSMKIQKIPAHNKEAVAFSVNETEYSPTTGWVSILLPSTVFEGKDAVAVCIVYNDIKQWLLHEDRETDE